MWMSRDLPFVVSSTAVMSFTGSPRACRCGSAVKPGAGESIELQIANDNLSRDRTAENNENGNVRMQMSSFSLGWSAVMSF